jgi:hypothetical protein
MQETFRKVAKLAISSYASKAFFHAKVTIVKVTCHI